MPVFILMKTNKKIQYVFMSAMILLELEFQLLNNFHFLGFWFNIYSNAWLLDVGQDIKSERERGTHHVFVGSNISNKRDSQIVQLTSTKLTFAILEKKEEVKSDHETSQQRRMLASYYPLSINSMTRAIWRQSWLTALTSWSLSSAFEKL